MYKDEHVQNTDQDLKHRLDQMRLLLDVTNKITSHLDIRQLFKAIASSLYQLINCDGAGLTLYDPNKNLLVGYALEVRPQYSDKTSLEEGVLPTRYAKR